MPMKVPFGQPAFYARDFRVFVHYSVREAGWTVESTAGWLESLRALQIRFIIYLYFVRFKFFSTFFSASPPRSPRASLERRAPL